MADTLTDRQRRFVEEFLADGNATAAYKRAGYKAGGNSAESAASRLLRNVQVAEAIAAAQKERSQRTLVTADDVLRELARVGFSDPRRLYRPDGTLKTPCEWDDDVAAAVASVETDEETRQIDARTRVTTRTHKVKRWDKLSALEKLGKHLGMFKEQHEHSGEVTHILEYRGPADASRSAVAPAAPALPGADAGRSAGDQLARRPAEGVGE